MKVDSWKCDTCGIQKQTANRWWLIQLIRDGDAEARAERERIIKTVITEWEHSDPEISDAHLCGESCTVQWLSKHVLGAGQ